MKIKELYRDKNQQEAGTKCCRCGKRIKGEAYIVHDEENYEYIYGRECIRRAIEEGSITL